MSPSAPALLAAIDASGVKYLLVPGWNNPAHAAPGTWAPSYVLLHHTAGPNNGNAPSLGWVTTNNYAPVRACHFLIGRDGTVFVVYAFGCYHAGAGGPGKWGDGPAVARDSMNRHAYGIEIESVGTSLSTAGGNGYTPAQREASARLTAALLDLLGRDTGCAINHRTWAPARKSDTLMTDAAWHTLIAPHRGGTTSPPTGDDDMVTPAEIAAIAEQSAHAVWNKVYPDIVAPGAPASTASLLLRIRKDANIAAVPPAPPGSVALTPADIDAIATKVADLLAKRLAT